MDRLFVFSALIFDFHMNLPSFFKSVFTDLHTFWDMRRSFFAANSIFSSIMAYGLSLDQAESLVVFVTKCVFLLSSICTLIPLIISVRRAWRKRND